MHVDQQVVEPMISKGVVAYDLMRIAKKRNIPVVVLNHMTPFSDRLTERQVIDKVKRFVGDYPMVTNSKTATQQWGFGTPIIHGMKPEHWISNKKEPRILTVLSGGGMEKAYKRQLLLDTISILEQDYGQKLLWIGGDMPSRNSYGEYRDFLSRTLIYFNPTFNSPMPRARTEAMMSGACVVSTPYQDWDNYIVNGENGFLVGDNPKEIAELLSSLVNNYQQTVEVGERGRETAIREFGFDRWENDWRALLEKEGIL